MPGSLRNNGRAAREGWRGKGADSVLRCATQGRDRTKLSVKFFTREIKMENYALRALSLLYERGTMQYREKPQFWRGLALFRMQAETQQHGCYASKTSQLAAQHCLFNTLATK